MIESPNKSIIQISKDGRWVDFTDYLHISRELAMEKIRCIRRLLEDETFRLKFEDWSTGKDEILR